MMPGKGVRAGLPSRLDVLHPAVEALIAQGHHQPSPGFAFRGAARFIQREVPCGELRDLDAVEPISPAVGDANNICQA